MVQLTDADVAALRAVIPVEASNDRDEYFAMVNSIINSARASGRSVADEVYSGRYYGLQNDSPAAEANRNDPRLAAQVDDAIGRVQRGEPDPTRGATYFEGNVYLDRGKNPSWLPDMQPGGARIGGTTFFVPAGAGKDSSMASTVATGRGGYVSPVDGTFIGGGRSHFGADRSGGGRHHAGADWQAPNGSDVRAMQGGTVLYAGRHSGYGAMVDILHDDGTIGRYATHASVNVREGQRVEAGAPVGKIGQGHLHFEMVTKDSPIYGQMAKGGQFVSTQWWGRSGPVTADPEQVLGIERGTRVAGGQPLGGPTAPPARDPLTAFAALNPTLTAPAIPSAARAFAPPTFDVAAREWDQVPLGDMHRAEQPPVGGLTGAEFNGRFGAMPSPPTPAVAPPNLSIPYLTARDFGFTSGMAPDPRSVQATDTTRRDMGWVNPMPTSAASPMPADRFMSQRDWLASAPPGPGRSDIARSMSIQPPVLPVSPARPEAPAPAAPTRSAPAWSDDDNLSAMAGLYGAKPASGAASAANLAAMASLYGAKAPPVPLVLPGSAAILNPKGFTGPMSKAPVTNVTVRPAPAPAVRTPPAPTSTRTSGTGIGGVIRGGLAQVGRGVQQASQAITANQGLLALLGGANPPGTVFGPVANGGAAGGFGVTGYMGSNPSNPYALAPAVEYGFGLSR